jgi:hypothetical protein
MVSVVLTRRHSKCFWMIIFDSLKLVAVAAVLLVAAAALEAAQM